MKKMSLFLVAALSLTQQAWAEKIKIVATTTDLADIARAVAGDTAVVSSITSGREDPHTLTARPSFIIRARDADVWIRVGMELLLWRRMLEHSEDILMLRARSSIG